MTVTKCVCPKCSTSLKSGHTLRQQVKCPRCGTVFRPQAVPADAEAPAGANNLPLLLGLGGGALVLMMLFVVVVVVAFVPARTTSPASTEIANADPKPTASEPVNQPRQIEDVGDDAVGPGLQVPDDDSPWAASLTPEQQVQVNQAIEKGVTFLKETVAGRRNDARSARLGGVALVGLTLLACGIPANDPAVRKALERVRAEGPKSTNTYDLALCVLCLDRLGDRKDDESIQIMAARLMGGQNAHGWGYTCANVPSGEEQTFLAMLAERQGDGRVGSGSANRTTSTGASRAPTVKAPPAGKRQPRPQGNLANLPVMQPDGVPAAKATGGATDNSNTQFAVLAVWASQKHGVPVDRSLALVDAHFRKSQNGDGSWGYRTGGKTRVDSMTCAGLIGLAAGKGLVRGEAAKKAAGQKDAAIEKGVKFLSQSVGRTKPAQGTRGKVIGANAWGDLYYLWSLERVAVIYDLRTVEGKEWYSWGANILVKTQQPNGSWSDAFPGVSDTCFALLFLKKANVAQDLTDQIRTLNLLQRVEK